MVLAHPGGAEPAADLLVRHGHQQDVTLERHVLPLQRDEGVQLSDARALHVDAPRPHNVAFGDLAAEGVALPSRRVGRHDVHVMQEQDRLGRPAPFSRARTIARPGPDS